MLSAEVGTKDMSPDTGYFADRTGQYNLDTLRDHPQWFVPLTEKPWLNRVHTHWYRIHLHNPTDQTIRSEEHTSELQSRENLVCRLLLEKKKRLNRYHKPQMLQSGAS